MNTTFKFHFHHHQPEEQLHHHFHNNNNYISGVVNTSYEDQQQRQRATAFFHAGSESPSTNQNYDCDEEDSSQYSLSEFSQIHLADAGDHQQQVLANGAAPPATNFANQHHHFQGFQLNNHHPGLLNSCLPTSTADCSSSQDQCRDLTESVGSSISNSSNRKRALSFNNGTNTGTSSCSPVTSQLTSTEKRTATKICRVCGDKAYSYNFNVITCESCKAFFRRNANKEKEIRCPFNEQCDINIVSRRFCQRCRLQKCFRAGMKKEWIMSEEARMEKKQRIADNRERRMAERNQTEGSTEELSQDCSMPSTATATAMPVNPMEILVNTVENNSGLNCGSSAALLIPNLQLVKTAGAVVNTVALPVVPTLNTPALVHAAAGEVVSSTSNNTNGLMTNTTAQHMVVAAAAAAAVSQALQQSQVVDAVLLPPAVVDGLNHQAPVPPTITTASSSLCFGEGSSVESPSHALVSAPKFGQIASSLAAAPSMLSNHAADAALAAAAAAAVANISSAPTAPVTNHPSHLLLAAQQQQQAQQHHQQQQQQQQIAQFQAAAVVQAAQLEHQQQVFMQQHQASQFLQAQAQSQQQQAAVVAAQLQQQQLAAAVAASQCIPAGLPPSTMVHSMLQPSSVVDLVAGQQSLNGQQQSVHSTNVGHVGQPNSMVVPAGSMVPQMSHVSSGTATLITNGVPAQLQQTAFGVSIEPMVGVSQVANQQPTLLAPMLNAQMDTGVPVVGSNSGQQPVSHHHSNPAASNSSQEMIAIPKDVLMKLVEHRIENDQQQQQQLEASKPVKCQCHCQCGRYPNEVLIVDKVMTDLLENSSKQYNNDTENRGNRMGCSSASSSNSFRMESNSSVNSNTTPTSFLTNGTNTQKNSLCGFEEQKVNPADYCNLTLNDQENLNELLRSNTVWNSEAGETQYGVTENGLRRLIRMISSVSGFRILDRYDQTLLLKHGCESYFVLRGTSSYNDTKISYLLQNRVSENIINFYKDFPMEWRNSETVILLLGMILLFDPQIPDLHNQLSVTVENMKYVLLLKHVLFTLCSQDINRSAQVFQELIARLDQLKTIGTLCQTENFEPIVQQMFEPQMVIATPSTAAMDTIISMANNNMS